MAEFQDRLDKKFMGEIYTFEDYYWYFQGIRYFAVKALERMPEFQQLRQKPIVALDAGCGTGGHMVMLSRYGKAFGVDLLEECVRKCKDRRLNICRASILDIPFKKDSFDLVGSFDVLVSLEGDKDVKALRNFYDVCRPGGLLVLNLAAFNFLYSGHSVIGGDVRRYTRGELKAKVEQAGFKVLKLTYRNMFLFPLVLAVRAVKNFQSKKTSDFYPVPTSINSFFYGLLKLEAWLFDWFNLPVGSSVFCIAQKPK